MVKMEKPNLKIMENFILESDKLFSYLRESVAWDQRMKSRKTASFGVSYDYSGMTYPQTDMPEELMSICEKIKSEIGFTPNNCLLNYYPDGNSSMGYHSDSAQELYPGTGVVIISLGCERHIHYKLKTNKDIVVKYKLPSGLLLYMDNEVQKYWLHSIPKEIGVGERISLTFRKIIK